MTESTFPVARSATAAQPGIPRLSIATLSKTFGSARVLREVAFDVRPGEIHALVGQNGSGKSTLAKILSGLYTPDAGSVVAIDGEPFALPVQPSRALARGMAVVHQSLGLVDEFTVLENLRVGRLKGSRFLRRIDWKHEIAQIQEVFDRIGRSVPLSARAGALSEEDRATVAIARALQDATPGRGLIIFDESTRALGRRSLEQFFRILSGTVATGTSVLLITHRLEEVIGAADRVTIMRDGRTVVSGRDVAGMTESDLAGLILGRDLVELERHTPATRAEDDGVVRVQGVRGRDVTGIDFEVRRGEVLGFTGLAGSGYDDVPYLIGGATRAEAGSISLPGRTLSLTALTPRTAIDAGIALLPEGRETAGLAAGMSIAENIALAQSSRSPRSLLPVPRRDESGLVAGWVDRLDVRPPVPGTLVGTLSGGNQQKVLLAKWLATKPTLLALHEPTQAVDVGARHTIVDAVRKAAADGMFVVVAGSDENELAMLCDRVLVVADGQVVRQLEGEISPDDIVSAIYTNGSRSRLRERPETPAPR